MSMLDRPAVATRARRAAGMCLVAAVLTGTAAAPLLTAAPAAAEPTPATASTTPASTDAASATPLHVAGGIAATGAKLTAADRSAIVRKLQWLRQTALGPKPVTTQQRQQLAAALEQALAGTGASVHATVRMESSGTVYSKAGSALVPPASTHKNQVAASALLHLPSTHTFTTRVVATSAPNAGTVSGDVWLVGGGDPWLTRTQLRDMARSIKNAGVSRITGSVLFDDSRYDALRAAPGWKPQWIGGEVGVLSALMVDQNKWRVDEAFRADPAPFNATLFRALLQAEGIVVDGPPARRAKAPGQGAELVVHRSAGLHRMLERMLQASDNTAAEMIVKEVGYVAAGDGSTVGGLRVLRKDMAGFGGALGHDADGSGLSQANTASTDALAMMLTGLGAAGLDTTLRSLMPTACRTGTMRSRMCGTAGEGVVQAKTGTLDQTWSLAGWTRNAAGRDVQFAFVVTGPTRGSLARAAIDRAVLALTTSTI